MSSAGSGLINSATTEVELDAVVDDRCVVNGFELETEKRHAHHCRHSIAENWYKSFFRKKIIFNYFLIFSS